VIAIGTDILRVQRIEDVVTRLGDRFVARILTPAEREEYRASQQPHRLLAKRFAAKEAIAKALGTGIGRGGARVELSLADEADYVVAFAVLAR